VHLFSLVIHRLSTSTTVAPVPVPVPVPVHQLVSVLFFNEGKKKLVKSLAGEYDATAIQDRMNGLIDAEPVLMFSFTTCPFCIKAKSVLDGKNAKYTVIELDTDPDGKAIRAEMADIIGQTSVPAVWIGGEFVGGCNDGGMGGLMTIEKSGKLDGMLREVGAV